MKKNKENTIKYYIRFVFFLIFLSLFLMIVNYIKLERTLHENSDEAKNNDENIQDQASLTPTEAYFNDSGTQNNGSTENEMNCDLIEIIVIDTFENLINQNLPVNTMVKTTGYYEINDGGDGNYLITNRFDENALFCYQLKNGNYALYEYSDKTVNLGAIGAKDSSNDISEIFDKAISFDVEAIYFPDGEYDFKEHYFCLSKLIKIYGNEKENCIIKNITLQSDYGFDISNITFNGAGESQVIYYENMFSCEGKVIFLCFPQESVSILFDSCKFENVDYVSCSFNFEKNDGNNIDSDIVTNCEFINIGKIAIYHKVNGNYAFYSNNLFSNIGNSDSQSEMLAAIILGDVTNHTLVEFTCCNIINNTFENLNTCNDLLYQKHIMAANFIAIHSQKVYIQNNRFTNLLGYGDDREAIYTKALYSDISNNYLENAGLGEAYILCKLYEDFCDQISLIYNNTIIGDYGEGIRIYGNGQIIDNNITIKNSRSSITFVRPANYDNNGVIISGNYIKCGNGKLIIDNVYCENYRKNDEIRIIDAACDILIKENNIESINDDIDGDNIAVIGLHSISGNINIEDNNIIYSNKRAFGIYDDDNEKENMKISITDNYIDGNYIIVSLCLGRNNNLDKSREFYILNNKINIGESSLVFNYFNIIAGDNNDHLFIYENEFNISNWTERLYTNFKYVET